MPETMTYTGTLAIEECCECHMKFAMPADFQRRCRENGGTFYCPLGHGQHYTTTEVQKLKAELAREKKWRGYAETREQAARDQASAAERSARAYKGQATRLRNRAAAGVCPAPECHRHFEDLARHMNTKHPGFTAADDAESADADLTLTEWAGRENVPYPTAYGWYRDGQLDGAHKAGSRIFVPASLRAEPAEEDPGA